MPMSLNRRLLLAASLVLFVFLGVTGLVLDRAFVNSAEQAVKERLRVQVYALLAAADFADLDERLTVTEPLPDPRLSSLQSGLYAFVFAENRQTVWRSPSSRGRAVPPFKLANVADWQFNRINQGEDTYFGMQFTAAWENDIGKQYRFVFQVLEDFAIFNEQVEGFRNGLWGWLLGVSLILLLVQGMILSWSLRPLRAVVTDLERVKAGEVEQLDENYPAEIQALTERINLFIESERSQRDRYRNTLADLAHSLKTPLAVLKGGLGGKQDQGGMHDQIDRMKDIVDYQLQRASASGGASLGVYTPLHESIQRIVDSLNKVHADKGIDCQLDIEDKLQFAGERGDLMEMMGNLLENAYKWAQHNIRISASRSDKGLLIYVEDDGPGVPKQQRDQVLLRGRRADENVAGHGIGLAVVQDIVSVYKGTIEIESSALGGAMMKISFPEQTG